MWNLSSRVHKLNHFPNEGVQCYVKRDDELGCGISGSKLRKYSSLMPYLMGNGVKHLFIIAGPQSNNLLAALQMAREFQFKVTALLLKPRNQVIQGNFRLSSLFLHKDEIIWIDRDSWSEVEDIAYKHLKTLNEPGYVLKEGASVAEAMTGAMSIAHDIQDNEQRLGLRFQHIFIDAGTGFSAAALIKGMTDLKHTADIHVLLLADDEETYRQKLTNWIGEIPAKSHCFSPKTAKSFGSVNKEIKQEIRRMAYEEGILADPIYAAKLFHESRRYIEDKGLTGNVLLIHSGGTLTMAGFDLD